MAKRRLLLVFVLSVTCPAARAQAPAGPEFQINSHTTGTQWLPAVASDANGNVVVVWESYGQDGSGWGVFGQRYNAPGVPQGSEFQVNSYTKGHQRKPAVGSDADGNFVVVWESFGQDGSSWGIFGQRFNAAGLPQWSEFQVNSYTAAYEFSPAVASDANGNFVVVWTSAGSTQTGAGQDGSGAGVFGQCFNTLGVPQGGEFQVNSYTHDTQDGAKVASDANGNFVVVWYSLNQDGSGWGVFGQRFNASGVPQASEFQVNSFTTGTQLGPAVASASNGAFVVTWFSNRQDGSGWGVFGQRFDALGVPLGSEFQVNSYTTGTQCEPVVASTANGNFVVAWESYDQDGSGYGIFGQRFDALGVPLGSEFQVNSHTFGTEVGPAVASAANGNFVVAWRSLGQDGSDYGIFGQRFGDLIFRDGFQ